MPVPPWERAARSRGEDHARGAPIRRDLGDGEHHAAAVGTAPDMDDGIDRGRDLRAHRGHGERDAGEERQRLEPGERGGGTVRVDGRERSVVTGVERLQHVERFPTAHLADDQPVGPHAQRGPHEFPHRHRAHPFGVRGPRFQSDDMGLRQGQLRRLFDGDDALARVDRLGQRVAQRRLARARCARDQQVPAAAHHRVDEVTAAAFDAERIDPDRPGDEAADRDARAIRGEGREHRVQPRSVGQAGIDQRRRVIEAETERGHDTFGQASDGVRIERELDRFDPALDARRMPDRGR